MKLAKLILILVTWNMKAEISSRMSPVDTELELHLTSYEGTNFYRRTSCVSWGVKNSPMVNFLGAPSVSCVGETSVPLNFGNVADAHLADGLVHGARPASQCRVQCWVFTVGPRTMSRSSPRSRAARPVTPSVWTLWLSAQHELHLLHVTWSCNILKCSASAATATSFLFLR